VPEPEGTRFSLRRTGGLIGGRAIEASVAEDELSDEERRRVSAALESVDFDGLAKSSPLRGSAADAYQYELVLERGDDAKRVVVSGRQPPAQLRPLIEMLEQRAEPALRRDRAVPRQDSPG
jgi:Emfourin